MKSFSPKYLPCLALCFMPLAMAQDEPPEIYTSQNVTLTLTESVETPTLIAKDDNGNALTGSSAGKASYNTYKKETYDRSGNLVKRLEATEYGQSIVKRRISNREILLDLVSDGIISTITGYSIVYIERHKGFGFEDEGSHQELGKFYVTKRGETPIDINSRMYLSVSPEKQSIGGASTAFTGNVRTETNRLEQLTGFNLTLKSNGINIVSLHFESNAYKMSLIGSFQWRAGVKIAGRSPDQAFYDLPEAVTMGSMLGMRVYEQQEKLSVMDGSLIMGTATVIPAP